MRKLVGLEGLEPTMPKHLFYRQGELPVFSQTHCLEAGVGFEPTISGL